MPFTETGNSPASTLADEIADDLITTLTHFKQLRVLGPNMTAAYRGKQAPSVEIGRSLNADYVVGGTLRRTADGLRVAVQLAEATTGAQIWTASYAQDTTTTDERAFRTQVATRVSATVGSRTGVIAAHETKKTATKSAAEMTPYQCVTLASSRMHSHDLARRARECLRLLLEKEPASATAWASLSILLVAQRYFGFGLEPPESTDIDKRAYLSALAVEAAQKASDLAPTDPYARFSLARAHYSDVQPPNAAGRG